MAGCNTDKNNFSELAVLFLFEGHLPGIHGYGSAQQGLGIASKAIAESRPIRKVVKRAQLM